MLKYHGGNFNENSRLFKAFEKKTKLNFQKILSPHFKPDRIKGITW